MIKKWARLLPFGFVMWYVKKISPSMLDLGKLGRCRAWRFEPGEWVVWSQDNYARMMENRHKREEAEKERVLESRKEEYKKLKQEFEEVVAE